MTPRVPALKPRKVIRTFQNAGYILDHTEGSHYFFTHTSDPAILAFPGFLAAQRSGSFPTRRYMW